jgi:hypothetical protein
LSFHNEGSQKCEPPSNNSFNASGISMDVIRET